MTVYVVQNQHKYDKESGKLVEKFDLSTAKQYGELEYLLSPKAQPFNPGPVIEELHDKLQNFTQEDYLLLVGNPCLIGFAVAIAVEYASGSVNLLQWSGTKQEYIPVKAQVFDWAI